MHAQFVSVFHIENFGRIILVGIKVFTHQNVHTSGVKLFHWVITGGYTSYVMVVSELPLGPKIVKLIGYSNFYLNVKTPILFFKGTEIICGIQ